MIDTDLHYASLLEVSSLIASHDLSPVVLTEAMLTRIGTVDPALNSYLSVAAESALAEAAVAKAEKAAHAYQQATDWHTRRPPLS